MIPHPNATVQRSEDLLVLEIGKNLRGNERRAVLFCRERSAEREIWEGFRHGPDAARDAFALAAGANDLELSDRELDHLIEAYSTLAVFPDVPPALETLQRRGLRMAMLSNLPRQALDSSLRAGGIERYFQQVLSTDRVKKYKPAPEAYAW